MKIYRIIFVIGVDRPGIVDLISTILFKHGANLEDSRMAVLGGRFSVMALFSCEQKKLSEIEFSVKELEMQGFSVSIHEALDPGEISHATALPLKFEIQSMDHPGITQKIVNLLAKYKVNIESLDTLLTPAPLSGTPLFHLSLFATVPSGISIMMIKDELTKLAVSMDLDLIFTK